MWTDLPKMDEPLPKFLDDGDYTKFMRALAEEMVHHMVKEEQILFPLVREREQTGTVCGHGGSVANPIRQMERASAGAGEAVARLRNSPMGSRPMRNPARHTARCWRVTPGLKPI
mgnify:CR=1 FL=1